MGHGTQVNGVQRDITGGMTLVNGVQRKITKGLTLVNGVQRDIGFGSQMFTITMTGRWNSAACYISIDGVKYYAAQTIEVPEGTEIYCRVYNGPYKDANAITLDGVGVATRDSSSEYWYSYTHTVRSDLIANGATDDMDMATYVITITIV